MALFQQRAGSGRASQPAWKRPTHEDMHGGELEVSILLAVAPELVREIDVSDDHVASDRTHLHVRGMSGYTSSGIIGRPSLGDKNKGKPLWRSSPAPSRGLHLVGWNRARNSASISVSMARNS